MKVPESRIRVLREGPVRLKQDFVLYWMNAARRLRWNFALDRALELAKEHRRPLVVLEAVRVAYPWASDRIHGFLLEGMLERRQEAARLPLTYVPYVEPVGGHGRGLLRALASRAVAVVTDDFPCFFLPRMLAAATSQLEVRFEAVDANGLLPLATSGGREFPSAHAFRRFLQLRLPQEMASPPAAEPFAGAPLRVLGALPEEVEARWLRAGALEGGVGAMLRRLPIDHAVGRVRSFPGGERPARARLRTFLSEKLDRYGTDRNEPGRDATSGLSPYLHFGHLAIHEVVDEVLRRYDWDPSRLGRAARGSRTGWWGLPLSAEAFLDEAVTWRELGFHFCRARSQDYDRFESLPDWARQTLARHASERDRSRYRFEQLEAAESSDPIWNAAQRQLLEEGRIHNYLRMVWGKRLLEWGPTPKVALEWAVELNNRLALDGRDPNSYTGIFWCFGRFDRPWGPERPIFGTVRYMSSQRTAQKFDLGPYLERFGAGKGQLPLGEEG